MRPSVEVTKVLRLVAAGLNDCDIERRTGIPRRTVNGWRRKAATGPVHKAPHHAVPARWRPPDACAYAYLFGVYLGDGCLIEREKRSVQIVITLDVRYPGIIRETNDALERLFPGMAVGQRRIPGKQAVIVHGCTQRLLRAFPQHGPGRKHLRKIELVDWQRRLTTAHPGPFVRGLIHSDGCRCVNRFKTKLPSGRVAEYSYPRYFFSNLSEDIRRLFCEHLDLLGVDWSQSNHRNISVRDRGSVTVLDHFVGPKT